MSDGLKTQPSRLLQRLDAEIAAATSPLHADCKRAERAGYLARLGRFDEADRELLALRTRYERMPNVQISAWLIFAEGLRLHSKDLHQNARDKFLRAHSISAAAKFFEVQALSAAWLAHKAYVNCEPEAMVRYSAEVMQLAEEASTSARARASLAIAQSYHDAGRYDLADPWYCQVHRLSLADGDDMALSALLVNVSSLKCQQLRFREWCDGGPIRDDNFSVLSAQSATNFDRLLQADSLINIAPVRLAQILCVLGKFEEALRLFDENMNIAVTHGMAEWELDFLADIAWCKFNLGDRESALIEAIKAEHLFDSKPDFYFPAFAHWRLSQVFKGCDNGNKASLHNNWAEEWKNRLLSHQSKVLAALLSCSATAVSPSNGSKTIKA